MFSKLIIRNTKRSQKENLLFMSSLVISIISFYVVLSLRNQDVIRYIESLESDAINKLLMMVTALYVFTLTILFFLIYYASKYQIERRSHELGVYLMMGMKRSKLFFMLFAEDIASSLIALGIGLPVAVLCSELMSLISVKLVGIGFIEHKVSLDYKAMGMTLLGFLIIKLAAFLRISFSLFRKEVGTLLQDAPDTIKRQKHPALYLISSLIGIACLCCAYYMSIKGYAWLTVGRMLMTVCVGLAGTFLLFWGLRFFIGLIAGRIRSSGKLHVFTFRQVQDTVIYKSGTMAVCSLLILFALICLGSGVGLYFSYDLYEGHIMDYTFRCDRALTEEEIEELKDKGDFDEEYWPCTVDDVKDFLKEKDVYDRFSFIDELRIGHVKLEEDADIRDFDVYNMDNAMAIYRNYSDHFVYGDTENYEKYPYLIRLSDYNKILINAGKKPISLKDNELSVYMDGSAGRDETIEIFSKVMEEHPEVKLCGESFYLTGTVHTESIVADYLLSPAYSLIVTDEVFDRLAQDNYVSYLNGILDPDKYVDGNIFRTFDEINGIIDASGRDDFYYESYLNNMGRQLFYLVGASYVTVYLALIFLVIGNTVLGVQFLMNQKKSSKRYKTLIKLGADHKMLCGTSSKQINWLFGIPVFVATVSCIFGIRGLYTGILSSRTKTAMSDIMQIAAVVILVLILIECTYIFLVKRTSFKYLKSLMDPEREE